MERINGPGIRLILFVLLEDVGLTATKFGYRNIVLPGVNLHWSLAFFSHSLFSVAYAGRSV
ncbi:MAG TPA: hypothetical protein VHE54_10075 [Puia sp.]|nr:hypothetical protein [Puia sp.]